MTRQEAIAVLENDAEYMYSQDSPYCREAYQMAVEALKTEPVKHGRWISTYEMIGYRCSVCGKGSDRKANYCPNCGAKMEVEGS